jgi:hypothetical protein
LPEASFQRFLVLPAKSRRFLLPNVPCAAGPHVARNIRFAGEQLEDCFAGFPSSSETVKHPGIY